VEEYGLVGGILIIFLYMLLFFRVIRFIHHSPRAFGTLLAIGLQLQPCLPGHD
jgi:cell division protein FtsW